MTIVVEDGSGVTGANSYVTLAEARAYASARGVNLSGSDSAVEQHIVKSIDYLEAQRARYKGNKTNTSQSLQWPRSNVTIDNEIILSDEIPQILKSLQCQVIITDHLGIDLFPVQQGNFVIREKIGPLDTTFSDKIKTSATPTVPAIDALLLPLCRNTGSGILSTERL
jgi:hypothetical protein